MPSSCDQKPAEHVSISDVMRAYAEDAVVFSKQEYDLDLDYTVDSLASIDRILADYTKYGLHDEAKLSAAESETLWTFCKMIGAYTGEVIIRRSGGSWFLKDLSEDSSSACLLVANRIQGSPLDAVWRRLTTSNKGGMASYYRTLLAALAHSPSSSETNDQTQSIPPPIPNAKNDNRNQPKPWWKCW